MTVGEKIKKYLDDNGIKQTFVADKVGISVSQMSDICNRARSIDCVVYYGICNVLNVPYDTFLKEE